jgi:hypothetical protein
VDGTKFRTYLGDGLLLVGAGTVFVVQGISEDPNIVVMIVCVAVLTGRTAWAFKTWLGGADITRSSQSQDPPLSSQRSQQPLRRQPDNDNE